MRYLTAPFSRKGYMNLDVELETLESMGSEHSDTIAQVARRIRGMLRIPLLLLLLLLLFLVW
jgi:hypothetical protein